MMFRHAKKLIAAVGLLASAQASAVVTYANCPTLAPLPVTSFMPAAMQPIYNAENAFDFGMNVTIMTAVRTSREYTNQVVSSSFMTLLQNMTQTDQNNAQQMIEIERQYEEMKASYKNKLKKKQAQSKKMIFPTDEVFDLDVDLDLSSISEDSPTYQFVHKMCTTGKMNQMATGEKAKKRATSDINRRAQKLQASLTAVGSVNSVAKGNIDFHYDIFCSAEDVDNGLCEMESTAPNADISAFNFLYPTGYKDENSASGSDYATLYTYSSVESLAAFQYVKNLSGVLYIVPPTQSEMSNGDMFAYVGAYKQAQSALNLASTALLSVAQNREPINGSGLVMSSLDVINYQITNSSRAEEINRVKSSSEAGKMLELQRQMAISNQLKLLLLRQKDYARQLKAAHLAIDNTIDAPTK
ncbi:MAG: hypothetical protein CL840_03545 [Crocinitomicaceae bacterium]|nr:hypothetical protein [Crocinitomicaceae bacterium]|tara:strand:- start:708 stop:1946 length:1239 start_codon:yes stop_codon:yes gene_type:complete